MTKQINQKDSQGRRHGVWRGYYLGGAPCWEGFWDHGRLKGLFIYRDHEGIPINKRYSLNIK